MTTPPPLPPTAPISSASNKGCLIGAVASLLIIAVLLVALLVAVVLYFPAEGKIGAAMARLRYQMKTHSRELMSIATFTSGRDQKPDTTSNTQSTTNAQSPTAPPRDLAARALLRAEKEWAKHWIQQDDMWTTKADYGNFLLQVKKRSSSVLPESPSAADRLNGVEWSGTVKFDVAAYRVHHFTSESDFMGAGGHAQGWADWASPKGSPFWRLELTMRNGKWVVESDDITLNEGAFVIRVFKPIRPTTSTIPQ